MKKMGFLKSDKMGSYELQQGYASYKTLVDYFIGDIVLCNNIVEVDDSVYENMSGDFFNYYNNATGEEVTREEYYNDNEGVIEEKAIDIFQYFLCNLNEYEKEKAIDSGLLLSYSDMLDCDVLCVNHFGTSWDYVLSGVKLFDNYEELEKYRSETIEEN